MKNNKHEDIKKLMYDIISDIIKEDKYRILNNEQIKELAIDILVNALSERKQLNEKVST